MSVVEKEFNALASDYEDNRLADWYQAHAEEMLKYCPDIESGDILDVGCGTGYFLRAYLKDRPGVRALGMDISSGMIEAAKVRAQAAGLDQLKFIHADWERFDPEILKGYRFKAIFCANAFHYFVEPQIASDKLFNHLAEDGALYVLERNKARSVLTFVWGVLHAVLIKDQVVFYKTSELIKLFQKAGFRQVRVLSTIKKYFWKHKLFTSIVLLECKKENKS